MIELDRFSLSLNNRISLFLTTVWAMILPKRLNVVDSSTNTIVPDTGDP